MQGVAFFSSTEFLQVEILFYYVNGTGNITSSYLFFGKESSDIQPFEHLFLTCHCSNTSEPYFFFPTSLKVNGRNASNGIALCVRLHSICIKQNG
uniref:Ovule protein n=1 Tax=Panagrolaimus sp. PS1159 TaxID=55785 RepID=A0AC35GXK5_9BILA